MRGFELRKIEKVRDLCDIEMDWILENYLFGCIKDTYVEISDETEFEPVEKITVKYLVIINNRLYIETADVWKARNGKLYIDKDEAEKYL